MAELSKYSFRLKALLWGHLANNSLLWFKLYLGSAKKIVNFSVIHKSHFLDLANHAKIFSSHSGSEIELSEFQNQPKNGAEKKKPVKDSYSNYNHYLF